MTGFRVWGVSAVLAAGGGPALAADPPARAERTTLVGKLFGPKAPKPDRPGPVTVTAPLPPAAVADALREEQEALLRRVSVCTELRQVAVEKGDDALARQADELERQAKALYLARVAGLGVPRADKAPLPESQPPAGDQTVAAKARRLAAPAAPTPAATASAKVWEVRP